MVLVWPVLHSICSFFGGVGIAAFLQGLLQGFRQTGVTGVFRELEAYLKKGLGVGGAGAVLCGEKSPEDGLDQSLRGGGACGDDFEN